jgi:hypothetical protein
MTTSFFEYSKPKVIQALRYHFISRKEIKVMMVLVNIFAIISAGLYFFKKITPAAFLMSSFLWVMMMLIFWLIMPAMVYRRSVTFKNRYRVILEHSRFTIETEFANKSWEWSKFSSWMESPHFFHLYFNPRSFFIIPKDIFEGDDQVEARNIIRSGIGK